MWGFAPAVLTIVRLRNNVPNGCTGDLSITNTLGTKIVQYSEGFVFHNYIHDSLIAFIIMLKHSLVSSVVGSTVRPHNKSDRTRHYASYCLSHF